MSQANVEKVRASIEAFNRGDRDGVVADFAPDFEYIPSGGLPDTDDLYRGPEEFKRFLGWLADEFDDARMEPHEFIDGGAHVVVSLTNHGRGKASGVDASWTVWITWTIRDGQAVRGQAFTGRAEALEAAGLSET